MKIETPSGTYDAYRTTKFTREYAAETIDQESVIEARRNYYYSIVLKPDGISNVPDMQKTFTPSETVQRAMAFKERNQSLKYFIGLIRQKVVT